MPGKIEVGVSPESLVVAAGDTAEASASLRNLGQTVDQLTLSIDGLDPSWYTLPVSSVALFPNDQDNLRILLHPPKTVETKAGAYPFHIKVISQENPEETATADASLEIRALPRLELDLTQQSITRRTGGYRIAVNNTGGGEARLDLKAGDDQRRMRYSLQPETLTVPGGGRAEAALEVKLGWLDLLFGAQELDFQVLAVPSEAGQFAEEATTVEGQLACTPWYRTLYKTLSQIRLPWLTRPPAINELRSTTDDRREIVLSWAVKRAKEVRLDDEDVAKKGEKLVRPTETTKYVLTAGNKYGSLDQAVEVRPLPIPTAKASERIRVSLSPTELQAHAGAVPAQATLQLQNLGEIVDKFLVEIEGFDETWYSRSASSIALMPQATDQVQISLRPPKSKGVKARVYPFAVTVRSQTNPEEAASVVGQLEVLPTIEFKLGIRPVRVSCRRKGTYRVNLANTGVSDINFALEATDLDEGCRFRFKTEHLVVAAWKTVEVPVKVKPKRGSMVGEKKRYDITVTAAAEGGNTQTVNCELYHNPFVGSWRRILRVLWALIIIVLLCVLIYYLLRWGGGWGVLRSDPQLWLRQLLHTVEGWLRGVIF
jgi:uncharacterized membrane protein